MPVFRRFRKSWTERGYKNGANDPCRQSRAGEIFQEKAPRSAIISLRSETNIADHL
jgi:hypothetical protein